MEALFSAILDMSLTASWVIAAILLIRLLLKRAPKRYSYILWIAAAFRLICPISIESAFSLFNLRLRLSRTAGVSLQEVPGGSVTEYIPHTSAAPVSPVIPDAPPLTVPDIPISTPALPAVPATPEPVVSLMGILAVVWCIGIAALLIYSIVTYIKLKRQMSTAILLEQNIRQAEGIRSPFILGFIRPQIYIPYRLSEAELSYVLAHERYHLKRGDHIIKPLAFLILAIHWFNPLVWLAFNLMVKDMEMSCDEKVLSRDESIRREYSSTLLSFAAGRSFPAPSPLSFGEGSVKSRIKNVLHWKKPALWLTIAAILICAAVILSCATNPREYISAGDVESVYARGSMVSDTASDELIELINTHSKRSYGNAPDTLGFSDSRVTINCADGSSYTLHHWYCSGFSFSPAHFGEDDYYCILSRINAEGETEKSWKMEYDFDSSFLLWLEKYSLDNPFPFGEEYTLGEAIFTRATDYTWPVQTAGTLLLETDAGLYGNGELLSSFVQTALNSDNWDNYLIGASGTWQSSSAKELRKNNFRTWRGINGDDLLYLLLQEDGTLYLAVGYYDSEGEYDSYSDDSNIRFIYELISSTHTGVRWRYQPYELNSPDYFPLEFDLDYSSIRLICTDGSVRYLDSNGFINFNMDIEFTEYDSDLGWWPTHAMDMSVISKSEIIFGRNDGAAELLFTATLKSGETVNGTIVFSNPKENDPDLFEAALQAEGLRIIAAPDGQGAVICREANELTEVYAPIGCLYTAPHSSYYPWGGDSGDRYIITDRSLIIENMTSGNQEVIPVSDWSFRSFSPYSGEWAEMFISGAPTFDNAAETLWLPVSDRYILLKLNGSLHLVEKSGEYVWAIYSIVPETQLGSAVWEHRPELSSRSPWFEFEFDMEYESLQIDTSSGSLSSDGSRIDGNQLGIPSGYTARWSPLGRFQPSSGAQLHFTITLTDERIVQGTIYISSDDGTLYTAVLRANGLHLSNDEEYGHAVITAASDGIDGAFHPPEQPEAPELPFATDLDELLNKWQAEGVGTLSEDQLARLNRNFVPGYPEANRLSSFFQCYYDQPEDINLAAFLQYNLASRADYTEADFNALKQQYPSYGQLQASDTYEDAVTYGNPIHKYPRELVDDQLMRYAGITTADLTADIDSANTGLVYLAESDAYFNFFSDMGGGSYTATSGRIDGDTVYLRGSFATLTLKKWGDIWLICSHTYDDDAATTANIANSIIEIFDVGGELTITEYSDNGTEGASLTITDREIAKRYSNILESCRFTRVDAPAAEPDAPRLEYTPASPVNRLIIWDSETPLLRCSPRGQHEYYTFTSDVWDSIYDVLYKSFDGQLQQIWLEERRVYTSDMNELLNGWQAEGVTELSLEQRALLNKNFIPVAWNENGTGIASVNPISSFFQCRFERPEDIDLAEFLRYNGLETADVTDADFAELKKHGDFPFSGAESIDDTMPIHKYRARDVDALLMKYAGITTDDLTDEARSGIIYLKKFDAYYNFTSDFGAGTFSCTSGKIVGDTAYLYEGYSTLTLKKSGGSWLICSYTYDEQASLRSRLASTATSYFDQRGAFYLTLYTSGNGAHETLTISDRSVAEAIDRLMQEYTYTELEMPYTEPSEYRLVMEPVVRVNKMTFWSGSGNMVQDNLRGTSSYYGAKTESGANLARALRRIYEGQLLQLEHIGGFAAENAEAAAEQFTETVYGDHLMSVPAGGVYSIEDYDVVEHNITEVSENGDAVLGRFTFAVWPEEYQKSGWWADNGIFGTAAMGAEYYGRILCTREYILRIGKDGLWHCTAIGTDGLSLTYGSENSTADYIANQVLEIFDIDGRMDIALHTADQGVKKIITVTDRTVAEKISKTMADFSYDKLEAFLTKSIAELSDYWITIVPATSTSKMVLWSGSTEMVQYSYQESHSYYGVNAPEGYSLTMAVLQLTGLLYSGF